MNNMYGRMSGTIFVHKDFRESCLKEKTVFSIFRMKTHNSSIQRAFVFASKQPARS